MSSDLAIEKLRRMQRKLPVEESGPELADMLAVLEGIRQAEAELRTAAEGQQPRRWDWWGMDGADRNPALFKASPGVRLRRHGAVLQQLGRLGNALASEPRPRGSASERCGGGSVCRAQACS